VSTPLQYLGGAVKVTRRLPRSMQFLISGGLGYLLGALLLFLFIDKAGLSTQAAYVIQAVVTFGFVWILNRYVTWHDHTGSVASTLPTFLTCRIASVLLAWAVYSLTIGCQILLPSLSASVVTIHYQAANALGVATATVFNYLACKHIVFSEQNRAARAFTNAVTNPTMVAGVAGVIAVGSATIVVASYPMAVLLAFWMLNALVMILVAVFTASRMLYGWQTPERTTHVDLTDIAAPNLKISLIVPARHEPILARTLNHLLDSDYPKDLYEILVVVGDDDPETELLARGIESQHGNVLVIVDDYPRRSKPRALEAARPYCSGDLIGIVDAESIFASKLLSYVNSLALERREAGIFQGGVQLMNHRAQGWVRPEGAGRLRSLGNWFNAGTSWWRARNCLEYYVWFVSRLRYQAETGFVPLGGNTVFVRRQTLEDLGGWDVNCLTEDCELGVRASARGVETVVFHHPDLVTLEETPDTLGALVVQRTRWMSGFIQVYRKGEWRSLPRGKRLRAVEALTMPFFQAYAGIAVVVSIVLAFTLNAPVGLVLFTWVPLLVTVANIALEHGAFKEFTRSFGLPCSRMDSLRLIVSTPFYQLVLSAAAVRSTIRMARGQTAWEKTAHSGRHLDFNHGLGDALPALQAAS
jgi:cellulose synthase/poly-beta-1,6-N-acetylglucosamine synthase-like glycosyltransferase